MLLGFMATVTSFDHYLDRPSSFAFLAGAAIWFPIFWIWHFVRYRTLRIAELGPIALNGPLAFLFVLPVAWMAIVVLMLSRM